MSGDELRQAIELPAQRVRLDVEADLVDALVGDVEGEPGGLPLLSAALLELWEHRDGRGLTHAAYARTGGVRGAVARLAEDAFGRLDPSQQRLARAVMLRLAGEDAGGAVVRRRVPLSELEGNRPDDLAAVLAVLTERRLLTTSATTRRGGARGAAAGVATPARLARRGRRGPPRLAPPRGRRARLG